jgi:predicted PurR-regulated permease PerM
MASSASESSRAVRPAPGGAATNGRRSARHFALAGEEAVPHGLAVAAAVTIRIIIVGGGLYLLAALAMKMLLLVIPLVVALLLTTIFEPPARYLQQRGWRPVTATAATVGGGLIGVFAVLSLIIPQFVSGLGDLGTTVEQGVRQVADTFGGHFGMTERQIERSIDQGIKDLEGSGGAVARGVLSGALLLTQWAGAALLALVLTFFLVKDGHRMWQWFVGLSSPPRRPALHEMGMRAWGVLTAYVRGAAIVAIVDAVLIGLALVAVGVPLALPLAVLTFLAAFFPIVGAFLAGAAAVLVALVANGPAEAGIILAAVVVVQQLEGNLLYPVVVGRRLRLHPVVMLIALTAGGVLAGLAGAFLAVPVAAVMAAILEFARSEQPKGALPTPSP